jgi:hypothetical protein
MGSKQGWTRRKRIRKLGQREKTREREAQKRGFVLRKEKRRVLLNHMR